MVSKPQVLIVDENPLIGRLFGSKLSSSGFEVLYAHEGNEGREIARRLKPDVVLLDINMPVMNGVSVAQRLKNDPATSRIPLAFLTNEDFSLDAEKAVKESLVVDYLHKSIDLDEFVSRVKNIVQKPREEGEDRVS